MVVFIILITVRIVFEGQFYSHVFILVNKTTSWTDPRIAGPVCINTFRLFT